MKLKIGILPNSYLDAKFEYFLCIPSKYLQSGCGFSKMGDFHFSVLFV